MDIKEFKRILTSFAEEPSDVDISLGKVVAQIRDDVIEATIVYSQGEDRQLRILENEQEYSARNWLINRVARLPQLADRIIASAASSALPPNKIPFVVASGLMSPDISLGEIQDQRVPNVVETLLAKTSLAAPGATSVLYLTSDAGEGKTTIINRAAFIQAQRYKEKTAHSLLVPIPLSGRAFLTFDDAVIAALVNKLRFNYFYYDAFIELVRMGVIVPAFDGYEEMLVEGSKGEAVSALGNLVQKLDSSGTVFIAARKAFFEYLSFRTQARLLDAIGDRSAAFSRLALSRWNKEQFCEYGRLRRIDAPGQIYETVAARLSEDHPLLTRAVLVRRLFDVTEKETDRARLAELLGSNPHDYFFTFVDTIVKREASEKWLARVSGDVMEPLLHHEEHHQLLSQIALEMWESSTSSLRHDVLDVIVEIFCENLKKRAAEIRQIKERLKQHSLLSTGSARAQSTSFDHEDFQNFYLGEGLGLILINKSRGELQPFLSVNIIPTATIEQAIQYLNRHGANFSEILSTVLLINKSESGFSFCKENCGSLALRIAECLQGGGESLQLFGMFFSAGALAGRKLENVTFEVCHFQPTAILSNSLAGVNFINCDFERLEIEAKNALSGSVFSGCKIDSLVIKSEDEQTYDPNLILQHLEQAGAGVNHASQGVFPENHKPVDEHIKLLEKFLRGFLRHTHIDEEGIRLRLGKGFSSIFFDELLPDLLSRGILEETTWSGRGVQRRFKLAISMAEINDALEQSNGSLQVFFAALPE